MSFFSVAESSVYGTFSPLPLEPPETLVAFSPTVPLAAHIPDRRVSPPLPGLGTDDPAPSPRRTSRVNRSSRLVLPTYG